MENLVIFGGSFDPIHNGHMKIASAAALSLNADVVFVPSRNPRWKKPDTTPEDRLNMLKIALKETGEASFSIDLFEMKSDAETNYTIDTVKYFRKKHKDCKLYLLIGYDSVNTFADWKDAEEIAKIATPLYVPREGVEVDSKTVEKFHMRALDYHKSGPTSSSSIRALQCADTPLGVLEYIEKHNLYYMDKVRSFYSERRLAHAISVANLALRIAQANHCEGWRKAYIAGLLHDIAKGMEKNEDEAHGLMQKYYPEFVDIMPSWSYHQFLGEYLAKTEFGIEDPAILDAIKYHTSGKAHMAPLTKIIYASDKIDPTRGFDSSNLINQCMRNYYVGFLAVLESNKEYFATKNYTFDGDPLSKACADLYLGDNK